MKIGSMDPTSSQYQSYRLRDIPSVDAEQIKKQEQQKNALQGTDGQGSAGVSDGSYRQNAPDTRTASVDLQNISLTFNPSGDGGTIGRDSSLMSLDMQKAISDMKKDELLQGYQYFVGSSQNLSFPGQDGIVIQKN